MRRQLQHSSRQHHLSFARLDIWQSIPAEDQRQCRDLCEQMLRATLEYEAERNSEVDCGREDSSRAS